jgi:hypothetical protein
LKLKSYKVKASASNAKRTIAPAITGIEVRMNARKYKMLITTAKLLQAALPGKLPW